MSVDRGFLGRISAEQSNVYRSMENLSAQKATGLELVRLLRVSDNDKRNLHIVVTMTERS